MISAIYGGENIALLFMFISEGYADSGDGPVIKHRVKA
jgi:hypothetical protein